MTALMRTRTLTLIAGTGLLPGVDWDEDGLGPGLGIEQALELDSALRMSLVLVLGSEVSEESIRWA